MKRRLFTILSAVSLLLLLATLISWPLSYAPARARALDQLPTAACAVQQSRGRLRLVLPLGREHVTGPAAIPFPTRVLGVRGEAPWSIEGTAVLTLPDGLTIRVRDLLVSHANTQHSVTAAAMDEFSPPVPLASLTWQSGRSSIGPVVVNASSSSGVTFRRWWSITSPHWYVLSATAILPALWLVRTVRRARRTFKGACPSCGYDLRATPDRCPECGQQVVSP